MPGARTGDRERTFARSLLRRTLRVRPGESVTIEAWTHALPWATACAQEAVEMGAHPMILYQDDATFWRLVDNGRARELGAVGDHELAALGKTDAYAFFEGPSDRGRYHALPEATRHALESWQENWWNTIRKSGTRCAWILLGRAVAGSARYHGIALGPWREELYRASLVDPASMRRVGDRIARRKASCRSVEIRHRNGTALTLRLRGRVPVVHDGSVDAGDLRAGHFVEEVPSGYVPVAVDERFAEGTLVSNVPGRGMDGHVRLEGGRWEFARGRLTSFHYARGEAVLAREYAAAPPEGRDRPGVLSIGLNPYLTHSPLVTDQRLGRVMLMIGGNEHHGGSNANPFRAYLMLDGATVEIDGRAVLRDGRVL